MCLAHIWYILNWINTSLCVDDVYFFIYFYFFLHEKKKTTTFYSASRFCVKRALCSVSNRSFCFERTNWTYWTIHTLSPRHRHPSPLCHRRVCMCRSGFVKWTNNQRDTRATVVSMMMVWENSFPCTRETLCELLCMVWIDLAPCVLLFSHHYREFKRNYTYIRNNNNSSSKTKNTTQHITYAHTHTYSLSAYINWNKRAESVINIRMCGSVVCDSCVPVCFVKAFRLQWKYFTVCCKMPHVFLLRSVRVSYVH